MARPQPPPSDPEGLAAPGPGADPEFAAACAARGVDPDDRAPLQALLASWGSLGQTLEERREALLRDYGHWRLYQASREGDETAAREFERYWRRYVGAFLRGRCTPEQVDEIAALFLVRVYRLVVRRHRWESPFVAYLRSILVNLCRDEGRRIGERRRHERSLEDPGAAAAHRSPAPGASAERQLLAAERRQALARALDRLAPVDLYVLRQTALEERPGPEVAAELGIALPALWKRVERAKRRLRQLLAAEGFGQAEAPARSRGAGDRGPGGGAGSARRRR